MSTTQPHQRLISAFLRRRGGWLAVAAGGLVGSAARTGIGFWLDGDGFPTPILLVNLAGSLLLGFYLARRERAVSGRGSFQFWAIGALGSFTTFSTFSVDLVRLVEGGQVGLAASYLLASTVGGLGAAVAGLRIGNSLG
jgi:CrcB protein